jgi:hypothetical protein
VKFGQKENPTHTNDDGSRLAGNYQLEETCHVARIHTCNEDFLDVRLCSFAFFPLSSKKKKLEKKTHSMVWIISNSLYINDNLDVHHLDVIYMTSTKILKRILRVDPTIKLMESMIDYAKLSI